ncbi:MAG: aldo/keto reductase [Nitrospirae bacterium]|nr:aldo/keto reductase [Nitrospirota bacterium]
MKLGLGTVQFGMDYGISNIHGRTSVEEAREILHFADEHGIELFDTAYSYGDSETVLGNVLPEGHSFRIVTKTPVFKKDTILKSDRSVLMDAFNLSLERLRQDNVYGLLIHHADDLITRSGEILFSAMAELKEKGLVSKIGASVYTSEHLDFITDKFDIDIIQLPINVLDRRLIQGGHLTFLKEKGVEIHARSVFLQGLLLMSPDSLHPYFDAIKPMLKQYHAFLQDQGVSPIEGALCFIRNTEEIDYVILGVASVGQLELDVNAFRRHFADELIQGLDSFSLDDPRYLNPALWRLQ